MRDYFQNEIKVGDVILMANRSILEEHVVISIPSHSSVTVSTARFRSSRNWKNKIVWEVDSNKSIQNHNGKITKWSNYSRIIKIGEFEGDMNQFKTINKLENEWQLKNPQS
jgi:hypothetical protein